MPLLSPSPSLQLPRLLCEPPARVLEKAAFLPLQGQAHGQPFLPHPCTDPEQKRKIIGEKFIRVFEREALEEKAEYLIQGTIAPDWIESGGGLRDTIKSHHNVGGLPPDINLEIVEPLRDLYKDEVRKVARALGLEVAEKQPFPGPGLAVRIIGEATEEKAKVIREACHIAKFYAHSLDNLFHFLSFPPSHV